MPAGVRSLRLLNCRLQSVPVGASSRKALVELDLENNELVSYPSDEGSSTLRRLCLRGNALSVFDAVFPQLEHLDLSNNSLKAFPSALFLLSNLRSLDMTGNPLRGSLLTPQQYYFLTNLSSLEIDPLPNAALCDPSLERILGVSRVCVVESTDVVTIRKSSFTTIIVAIIVGTATISIVLFVVWYKRKKRHQVLESQALAELEQEIDDPSSKVKRAADDSVLGEQGDRVASAFVALNNRQRGVNVSASSTAHTSRTSSSSSGYGSGSLWDDDALLAVQLRFEDIQDLRLIGSGAFGVVWLVRYRNSRLLASKRLVRDQITRAKTMAFVTEIKLVARLEHPSIVQFVGAAWTVESDLQALFEYMPHGDLRSHLDASRGDPKSTAPSSWRRHKLALAIDIAEALVYVHSFNPPLVHRDLKSRNVLLGDGMKAKLSDFGVSRFQSENDTMTAGVGTGRWLAPEVIAGSCSYDQSCDVYAFGVVLSELATHAVPYEDLGLAEVALLQRVATGVLQPTLPMTCPSAVCMVARRCLAFDRTERPSAMEIAFELRTWRRALEQEEDPDTDDTETKCVNIHS
ncbi:hypothetical protein PINS_up012230 [Pythium insidiosum]|nr:hypothetical protein PINS_up012230 [Pythium insidiosum]